ncbi:MAG: hypothetical protein Fur0046_05360 [Cyanobacteria bacterium J069]
MVHAFFVGRALAEALTEQASAVASSLVSEAGKFDAEQRDRLRQFTEVVLEKANRQAAQSTQGSSYASPVAGEDLQALIDDLRAEIAQLRTELQRYRSRSSA